MVHGAVSPEWQLTLGCVTANPGLHRLRPAEEDCFNSPHNEHAVYYGILLYVVVSYRIL